MSLRFSTARALGIALVAVAPSCSNTASKTAANDPTATAPPASAPPPAPAEPAAKPAPPTPSSADEKGDPCGDLCCRAFPSPEAAFAAVLAERPLVLGIGEAHAQKGS